MLGKNYFIGIDIGGSKISGAVILGKKIIKFERLELKKSKNKKSYLEDLFSFINLLIFNIPKRKIGGIGIAVPGLVDYKTGKVIFCPNLKFLNGVNLAELVKKQFGWPVKIENDVRATAWGEYIFGGYKDRGIKSLAMISGGTGLGGGMILDGKIYHGLYGAAGEFGHLIVDLEKGAYWESFFSAKAIAKNGFDPYRIVDLARAGDKKALAYFKKLSRHLGLGLVSLVYAINPEIIVLGGGTIFFNQKFLVPEAIKIFNANHVLPAIKKTKIVLSKLEQRTGACGAAGLFLAK